MHPAIVVKNLCVSGSMLISPLLIMSILFVRHASLKFVISDGFTCEAAILVDNALGDFHLDYCNSLFRSLSSLSMPKLQCICNTLVRIVTNYYKYTQASPILKQLHWIPVEFHYVFKTTTLVYKFLRSGHPS